MFANLGGIIKKLHGTQQGWGISQMSCCCPLLPQLQTSPVVLQQHIFKEKNALFSDSHEK